MVSPGNPLKADQPAWENRAQTVRDLPLPPRMRVSDIERQYGTRYTIDLLERLITRDPDTRFVFIMGADNLAQMPQWKDWQRIMNIMPVAVIARPGSPIRARLGQAARQYADARLPEGQARALKDMCAPAWTYLTLPLDKRSSSAIRATSDAL